MRGDNVANNGGGFNLRKALRSKAFDKWVEVNTVGSLLNVKCKYQK